MRNLLIRMEIQQMKVIARELNYFWTNLMILLLKILYELISHPNQQQIYLFNQYNPQIINNPILKKQTRLQIINIIQSTQKKMKKQQYNNPDNPLDLSSIDDEQKSNNNSSSIQIQQMGLNLVDQEEFKNNVRELLLTQINKDQESQNFFRSDVGENNFEQFDGEPVKGSFLRDMEILGKTISYQSKQYNVYEDQYQQNSYFLKQLQQNTEPALKQAQFIQGFRNPQKNIFQLELKYVLDFDDQSKKQIKICSKCKCSNRNSKSKARSEKKILSDALSLSKTFKLKGKIINRPKSQKKLDKNKIRSVPKPLKISDQEHRKSDMSSYIGKIKKKISSPLKKVGYNSVLSEALRTKQSEGSSLIQRQKRKKKIEEKLKLRNVI